MEFETERYCSACKVKKPLESFEFIDGLRLHRRSQCAQCRYQIKQGLIETRGQRKLREEMLAAFHGAAAMSDVAAFSQYLESMLGLLGGAHGAAEMYFECLMASMRDSPGSKKTIDAFRDFFKIWQAYDSGNKTPAELAGLTSDQLEERLVKLAETVLSGRGLRIVGTDDEGEVPRAAVG